MMHEPIHDETAVSICTNGTVTITGIHTAERYDKRDIVLSFDKARDLHCLLGSMLDMYANLENNQMWPGAEHAKSK